MNPYHGYYFTGDPESAAQGIFRFIFTNGVDSIFVEPNVTLTYDKNGNYILNTADGFTKSYTSQQPFSSTPYYLSGPAGLSDSNKTKLFPDEGYDLLYYYETADADCRLVYVLEDGNSSAETLNCYCANGSYIVYPSAWRAYHEYDAATRSYKDTIYFDPVLYDDYMLNQTYITMYRNGTKTWTNTTYYTFTINGTKEWSDQ